MFCAEVIIAAAGKMKSLKIVFFDQWCTSEQVIPRQHLIYKPLLDHLTKFINHITSQICHEIGMQALVLKQRQTRHLEIQFNLKKSIVYVYYYRIVTLTASSNQAGLTRN